MGDIETMAGIFFVPDPETPVPGVSELDNAEPACQEVFHHSGWRKAYAYIFIAIETAARL